MIIGASGQDGQYLAETLNSLGNQVIPIARSFFQEFNLDHRKISNDLINSNIFSSIPSIPYFNKLSEFIEQKKPELIFHLAAHHSHSGKELKSDLDKTMMWVTHVGITSTILETLRKIPNPGRLIIAGSSQMYSATRHDLIVNENTLEKPANYYGETKVEARHLIHHYRENYGIECQMAIMFNHESPKRAAGFLSTDIVTEFLRILKSGEKTIHLRNPEIRLDISDARDFVQALATMPEHPPSDFVLGSSTAIKIRDLVLQIAKNINIGEIDILSREMRKQNVHEFTVISDTTHVAEALTWKIERNIDETISEMIVNELHKK
jgi:GDP-mannose 4,6-dehydratase